MVRLESRHESHPETAAKLAAMREKVRLLVEDEAPETNPNGGDRRQFDISNCQPSGQGGNSRGYRIARLKRDHTNQIRNTNLPPPSTHARGANVRGGRSR